MSINFPSSEMKGCRDGFGDALVELGESNPNIVGITADLSESTRIETFAKKFPERFIDVGVAEQNMMGIAAGMALSGKIPFIASYATFSPGRNWDQLRVSVAYSNTNVKIVGAHAGISVGPDGATHQGLEDLAITRVLPNLVVISPCDYEETKKVVKAAAAWPGPVYIRFGREKTPVFTTKESIFEIGKANILRPASADLPAGKAGASTGEGRSVTIFATGPLVYQALEVAEQLKDTVDCEVINIHTLKPLDAATIMVSARKTGAVVTVEEHQVTGGLFGAISECLAQNYPVPIEAVGMSDCFGESGKPEELLTKYKMATTDIITAVEKAISRKKVSV